MFDAIFSIQIFTLVSIVHKHYKKSARSEHIGKLLKLFNVRNTETQLCQTEKTHTKFTNTLILG